jgi:membrane protein YdbS with pleckstrin-like domain
LFILANIIIIIGVAISWTLVLKGSEAERDTVISPSLPYIPMIICYLLSIGIWFITYWFNGKDIFLIKGVVKQLNLKQYMIANVMFLVNIILIATLFLVFSRTDIQTNIKYGITFGVGAFISLIVIGLYRYAIYKMEVVMYKRKFELEVKEKEMILESKKVAAEMSDDERRRKKFEGSDSSSEATSGLSNGHKK